MVDFQIAGTGILVLILVVATSTMALGDESFLTESFLNPISNNEPIIGVNGHIENFSWIQRVSHEGVIEISGISFLVTNDDLKGHLFQICTVLEGPTGEFTPSYDDSLACTTTEIIVKHGKSEIQTIELSKGVKVSDLVNISWTIQEL